MPESWKAAEENASSPLPVSAGTSSSGPGNGKKAPGPAGTMSRVPFHRLFAFADRTDAVLMLLGAVGAVANGAAMPLMTVLFGNLVDAFGGALSIHEVVNRVSLVSLDFIYLAFGSAIASFVRKHRQTHSEQTKSRDALRLQQIKGAAFLSGQR
jgi:ATP-binding cassette subfamily B (MDR/TAP) protein 1